MIPVHLSADGFPMAPTQEEWDGLTTEQREEVLAALPPEVTYEEMAPPEGDRHFKAKISARDALKGYFARQKTKIYISAELPTYYPKAPRFAPDLLAVRDVEDHDRDKWVVSAEGRGFDWVLEVHVGGDRKKDAVRNVTRYASHGIPEYFLYDREKNSLYAYRLPTSDARAYVPIIPQGGRYRSEVLGLEVEVSADRLRFFAGTALLLESEEIAARLESMIEEEVRKREEEARKREEEARKREEETRKREEETRKREDAEREVERLKLEIERLRRGS